MIPASTLSRDTDGFFHPASEEELAGLVRAAYLAGEQIRVRGAAHSVNCAVYTDPCDACTQRVDVQDPPAAGFNVMLDRYRGYRVLNPERRLVEAQAGIHLGADPNDPKGTATLESSLLFQLWRDHGWTLSDLGGITHQTVSGFVSTGSSGGSLTYSVRDNLFGFRMIDGTGAVFEVTRESDPALFDAVSPTMGLLGVISTVLLTCVPTFNISGQEAITTMDDSSVDFFGERSDGSVPLPEFLRQAEYTRMVWWPQRGGERLQVWQAQQIAPQPGFRPRRYEEFTNHPEAAEIAISVFFTIIGNLDDLGQVPAKLRPTFKDLRKALDVFAAEKGLGIVGKAIAGFIALALEVGLDVAIEALKPAAPAMKKALPQIFPAMLGVFVPLDSSQGGMEHGEPQCFRDYGWSGLPMDNQASDVLVPTEFTEMWIPIDRATEVTRLLRGYFDAAPTAGKALERTGTYGWEIYGAEANGAWLSPAYSSGDDVWKDGVVRVDIYWFAENSGNPAVDFFPQFWRLLRDAGIPFRLHWGKFQPVVGADDPEGWTAFFRSQYPRWDDFLALRAKLDPNNIFLTAYWRSRFGLWDAPAPAPVDAAAVAAMG